VVIDFHNMNRSVQSEKYVPVIGDMIASRWAYEALVVTQFKDNEFEKHFYEAEATISTSFFDQAYRIPLLESALDKIKGDTLSVEEISWMNLLKNELDQLFLRYPVDSEPFWNKNSLPVGVMKSRLQALLDTLSKKASSVYSNAKDRKQSIRDDLISRLGGEEPFRALKDKHHNKRLATLVQNSDQLEGYYIDDQEIIYLRDPVYRLPDSRVGRAHYFAPAKFLGKWKIDTFWFNIIRIWLGIFFWYAILYFDVLRRIISYFESIRLQRIGRKRFVKLFGLQQNRSFKFFPFLRPGVLRNNS
jgi:hypothetical protein